MDIFLINLPFFFRNFTAPAIIIPGVIQYILCLLYTSRVTVEYAPNPFFINDRDVTAGQLKAYAREIVDTYGAHANKGAGVALNINCNDAETYKIFETEIIEYSMKMYQ